MQHLLVTLLLSLICKSVSQGVETAFPTVLVIHGGYRPTLEADITLYRLAATSYLYSFFTQFDQVASQPLELVLWIDTSSYEDHIHVLENVLHNLEAFTEQLRQEYSWVKPKIKFSRGIAESYHRSLHDCENSAWCKYIMFTEDDWLFEHANIQHSALDLLDLMDHHNWVNYIRFTKREVNAILFDSPCVVEDQRLPIPLTSTGGFSNNAHLGRASAVQRLFDLVHDARTSSHKWGLECHQDMARHVTFAHAAAAAMPLFCLAASCGSQQSLHSGAFKQAVTCCTAHRCSKRLPYLTCYSAAASAA